MPLVGIVAQVVEFFAAVLVADVVPAGTGQRNIAGIEKCHGQPVGGLVGFSKQIDERCADQICLLRYPAEFDQGGVEIDQADRLMTGGS